MSDDPLKEAALLDARAGQPVFPCGVLGKRPNGTLVHHGLKDASARPADVENWWGRAPRSNIGWPTQVRASDPWVLDVDTKSGVDGWATVERLNTEHPGDPIPLSGPRTTTPSKPPVGLKPGGHVWLRARDELPVPSKVSFAPGLDTRGEGGYVVVAPSRTEDGDYRGGPPLDPATVPYAPQWLLALIRGRVSRPSPEAAPTPVPTKGGKISHGQHHRAIVKTAASLAKHLGGLDEPALTASVTAALAPMLDDLDTHKREIADAVRSALVKFGESAAEKLAPPVPADTTDGLIALAQRADLWHATDGEAYATLEVDAHYETYRLRSRAYEGLLRRQYWREYHEAPADDAYKSALRVIEALAIHDGPERAAHLRVAEHEGDLWVDLGDPAWRSVRVTRLGWTLERTSPVRFVRGRDMLPLPEPARGGSLAELRPFLSAASVTDAIYVLSVGWLVGAFHPRGPYPLLHLGGEQGTGKTQTGRRLVSLADPSSVPVRSPPREERDLAIALGHHRALVFDNLSLVPEWLSDALCRVSTGGGFATRQLWTDDEEAVFPGVRPLILTSVPQIVTQPDLLDRTLSAEVPPITAYRRDSDLDRDFGTAAPRIFGALLEALVAALSNFDTVTVEADVRMADHVAWVVAAEPSLPWPVGTYLATYRAMRESAVADAVLGHPVGAAVATLHSARPDWEGSMTDLLKLLGDYASPRVEPGQRTPKGWPGRASDLSAVLRRLAPGLRRMGVHATFERKGHGGPRSVRISASPPSPASPALKSPSVESYEDGDAGGAGGAHPPAKGVAEEADNWTVPQGDRARREGGS
ncbi:MAG TPA: bifunctional DNA primase/polymerase [Thermoplasmata archaeon]|nr:bifunctional DNA primase/polymerase [Thermoplasmata archaeon]